MRRVLITANTYYQLILAMQLKNTLLKKDYVTLMLSDHNNNSENVYIKLKEVDFFDEVIFVKSKGVIHNRKWYKKISEVLQLSLSGTNGYEFYLKDIKNRYYDEFINYNLEIDTYALHAILATYNKNIKYSSYEEGILSYNNIFYDSGKFKLIRKIRKMLHKPTILDAYDTFYCLYPNMYEGELNAVKIPPISVGDKKLIDTTEYIFQVKKDVDYGKYKCIYFESVYDMEGRGIGEKEIVLKIAEKIGKDNILIKKHPRSDDMSYEKMGMDIDNNSSVPFEVIQLNNDLSNCVLVSAMTGSVLSINAMVEKPSESWMIYPLTNYKKIDSLVSFSANVEKVIKRMQSVGYFDYVDIIENEEEFSQKFEKLL